MSPKSGIGSSRDLLFFGATFMVALACLACSDDGTSSGGSSSGGSGGTSSAGGAPAAGGATSAGGGNSLDAAFLDGTWVSGCDVFGTVSAIYCTTFSGTDGYASRTSLYSASTTCSGASNIVPGNGTYTLGGPADAPSDAIKVDVVIAGGQARYSILGQDGADLVA